MKDVGRIWGTLSVHHLVVKKEVLAIRAWFLSAVTYVDAIRLAASTCEALINRDPFIRCSYWSRYNTVASPAPSHKPFTFDVKVWHFIIWIACDNPRPVALISSHFLSKKLFNHLYLFFIFILFDWFTFYIIKTLSISFFIFSIFHFIYFI